MQWWQQGVERPRQIGPAVGPGEIDEFFEIHREEFSPSAIYRAKTWGRFDREHQLTFVDLGLMQVVEEESGRELGRLIERNVDHLKSALRWRNPDNRRGVWLLQSIFWLVAAKILRDKGVESFEGLDLQDVPSVFELVAKHYGTTVSHPIANERQQKGLQECARDIARFSNLSSVSTESLAYVYENTLISKKTRRELGTHSTPPYLVDYVVGKLADWIGEIPASKRHVFEPACGHAGFLVSAMRLLRELRFEEGVRESERRRHQYLQRRLHGCEIDPFAVEIARLSLTLADVPNSNGWDLLPGDVYEGDLLERSAARAMILLANPPFEDFGRDEKSHYADLSVELKSNNKSAEMLFRTLPYLPNGAVFGIVVPQGFLHSEGAADLREILARRFEIREMCLFADKVFREGDPESAILLGRKRQKRSAKPICLSYRVVREPDVTKFKSAYQVSFGRVVSQNRFGADTGWDFRVPELEEVWSWCNGYPRFGDVAKIGKGLDFVGKDRLDQHICTFSTHKQAGDFQPGFVTFKRGVQLQQLPDRVWLNLDPSVVASPRMGTTVGKGQILWNYARVKRSPWRLKGLLDAEGHAVTSRFLVARPCDAAIPLELLWAFANSPVANAFAHTRSMKRDNLTGTMRQIPIPVGWKQGAGSIVLAVREYFSATSPDAEQLMSSNSPQQLCRLLLQVDAEVLKLYDLPPRLERQLLDYFRGWERQGVPFFFDRYYPDDYDPCFSLHEYLSDSFQRSNVQGVRDRYKPVHDESILAALRFAAAPYEEI